MIQQTRFSVLLALSLGTYAFMLPPLSAAPPLKTEYFEGKVVPLAGLLEKAGAKLDNDAAPHWLALVTNDGKVYPLVKDSGSRLFFIDPKLQNRPMRLAARKLPDINFLQVVEVNSIIKGELHEVYYWCDICTIRRNEKLKVCDCCGGPLELKEVPLKK